MAHTSRDAHIFNAAKAEATALKTSPLLGPTLQTILDAPDLTTAVATVIASKLTSPLLPFESLRDVCAQHLRGDDRVGADIEAFMQRDPAAVSYLQCLLFLKGFHALQAYRVAHQLYKRSHDVEATHVALALQNRVSELFGVDIHPAARIGGGLLMDHATAIVIGETAKIGDDCTILHGVTLGGTGKERGDRHPKVGHGVTLGAGATVLGNVFVGDGATLGSQAVVTKDVPAGITVVGLNKHLNPANNKLKDQLKARQDTWQYELEGWSYFSVE